MLINFHVWFCICVTTTTTKTVVIGEPYQAYTNIRINLDYITNSVFFAIEKIHNTTLLGEKLREYAKSLEKMLISREVRKNSGEMPGQNRLEMQGG